MKELKDGSKTLTTSLSDGATTVKDNSASDETIKMFATPVVNDETKLTDVPNNGHAMAPYMMSVGLWVGALAFCLMYPLAQYKGKLKSGFAWWASKASVLYPVAILQGICLIMLLHAFNGFTPAEMGKTVLFACLTSMTFTSIMYFFNITLGKVGSFLMLVFMVVQLAGSAGTYPVEVSPSFVAKIHAYVPFTYTVDAFRATISGGRTITTSIIVMVALLVIFTILTILQFNHMTKRKKTGKIVFFDWLEERGLA
jgi:putative membrane protein